MLIILEGQDRTGKDTLIAGIRKLIQTPKILVHHSGPPPRGVHPEEWSRKYYSNLIDESIYLVKEGWTVIANRFHYGELVYGPLFRNANSDYIWEFESKFDPFMTALVVLVDEPENIIKRDDGMSTGSSIEELAAVKEGFEKVYLRSTIHNKVLHHVGNSGWPLPKDILNRINY